MIYFDNASTSYPKPDTLISSINHYLTSIGANPGRGGHSLEREGHLMVEAVRGKIAALLSVNNPNHILFTHNATHSSNIVIKGLLKPGDHVILSNFEHNAVFRPLYRLVKEQGVSYDIWSSDEMGNFDILALESLIKPQTRMIALNHASNVLGVLSPVERAAAVANKNNIPLLIDVAQTAGIVPTAFGGVADYITGTGHKSLLGPPGVGFLYVKEGESLSTLYEGGSGNLSASPYQPESLPMKFESGTNNYLGIAGLKGSLEYLEQYGKEKMRRHLADYTAKAIELLTSVPGLILYGPRTMENKVPLVSFNLEGYFPTEVAHLLNQNSICVRAGLHCSPLIHKTLGTFPHGTVRLSFGHRNTEAELEILYQTLLNIQKHVIPRAGYKQKKREKRGGFEKRLLMENVSSCTV